VILEEPYADPSLPYAQPELVALQGERGRFERVRAEDALAVSGIGATRGVALGDIDGDGDVDVLTTDCGGVLRLYVNEAPKSGAWIALRLLSASGSDALGAKARLRAGGRDYWRRIDTGASYCSSHSPILHFGLPAGTTIESIEVVWPDGAREELGAVEPGRVHVVRRRR
jgi:hypothetical protein